MPHIDSVTLFRVFGVHKLTVNQRNTQKDGPQSALLYATD